MKKIYFFLVALTAVVAVSCTSADKKEPEMDDMQTQGAERVKEYVNNLDSVNVNKIKKLEEQSAISVKDLAPGDTSIVMRTKKYYQTELGETLGVAYAYHRNGNSFIMLEVKGQKPITMQQSAKTDNGATYKGGSTTWVVNGSTGTFTEGGASKQYNELNPVVQ